MRQGRLECCTSEQTRNYFGFSLDDWAEMSLAEQEDWIDEATAARDFKEHHNGD